MDITMELAENKKVEPFDLAFMIKHIGLEMLEVKDLKKPS